MNIYLTGITSDRTSLDEMQRGKEALEAAGFNVTSAFDIEIDGDARAIKEVRRKRLESAMKADQVVWLDGFMQDDEASKEVIVAEYLGIKTCSIEAAIGKDRLTIAESLKTVCHE